MLASTLAATLAVVAAQFLDDLGDGVAAHLLGGSAVIYNNRVEITGASDLAWAGGLVLCLLFGFLLLFFYPTARRHGIPRLVMLWLMLNVLRQALAQAAFLPFEPDGQLARVYDSLELPEGLDLVIAAIGGVGLLLVALSAAAAFLGFARHRRLISTARKRFNFMVWIALLPAVVAAFAALPFFLPDTESLVIRSLPLTAVIFLATVAAAPGTTSVHGPDEERFVPWPWGLAAAVAGALVVYLLVLQGGVELDPRQWG